MTKLSTLFMILPQNKPYSEKIEQREEFNPHFDFTEML